MNISAPHLPCHTPNAAARCKVHRAKCKCIKQHMLNTISIVYRELHVA